MPQATLTQSFIDKATAVPDSERTIYWDKNRPGFGLMVTANGHRSYVVQYRAKGVSRRMIINGGVSLKDAMKQAQALQGEVAREHDPLEDRRKARAAQANSLRTVADEYFKREGPKLRSCKAEGGPQLRHGANQYLTEPHMGKYSSAGVDATWFAANSAVIRATTGETDLTMKIAAAIVDTCPDGSFVFDNRALIGTPLNADLETYLESWQDQTPYRAGKVPNLIRNLITP